LAPAAPALTAVPGYAVTPFAMNPMGTSQPDSIAIDGANVYVGYGNGVAKDGSDGKSSTIVQFTIAGSVVRTFSVPGHNDGLKVDPSTHLIWSLQNEDGNPNLVVIDPAAGTTTNYTFDPVANGGGFDDITFLGGKAYLSESNPANNPNTAPAIVQVTLSGNKASVTTVLLGNATATNVVTNQPATLNLQDPDSMTADPSGNLVLTSQADDELIIIGNPGAANQTVSLVPLADATTGQAVSVDDTLFNTSSTGEILVTDLNAGAIYQITGPSVSPGLVLSAAVDIGQLGTLNTSTGVFTPVITGMGSPRGLAFLSTGLTVRPGYTVTPFATNPIGTSQPDSIAIDGANVYVGYGNGVAKDGSDGKSSTIVQYTVGGAVVQAFSVPGHNDGLKVDPVTHLVWSLQNEDGNPNLAVIDPTAGSITNFTFDPVANGGGFDDITFLGSKVYLSESNPANNPNTAPAVVQVTLSGSKASVTTVLLGNATATNVVTHMTVTLNLQDPDSMTADPSGNLLLTSQADNELVTIKNPGLPNQSVTLLPLTDATSKPVSVDDTLFPPGSTGQIFLTDQGGTIYRITGGAIASGLVLSAALDLGQLGSLNTSTGVFTPVVIGLSSPRGLAFEQSLGFTGSTVAPVTAVAVIYSPHPNSDANTAFAKGLYQSVLGRSPDPGGLSNWVAALNANASRVAVAMAFWNSVEHRGDEVDSYYRSYLHRSADPMGRANWISVFQSGADETAVVQGFLTSAEYVADHSGSYVTALYQDILGRAPDPGGLQFWQGQLNSGSTMAQVAAGIIGSSESDSRTIADYYAAFLQRAADATGANSWLQSILSGQLNFASVAINILASDEYFSNAAANVP
jgi:hypothetical protein